MNDSISREAAINAICEDGTQLERNGRYRMTMVERKQRDVDILENLPSAQPTDADIQKMQDIEQAMLEKAYECGKQDAAQWIPCSERLPEEDHWLGGSGKQFSDHVLISIMNGDDEDEWVDVSHTIDGEWVLELPRHCKILAWMPLPEPYKEVE